MPLTQALPLRMNLLASVGQHGMFVGSEFPLEHPQLYFQNSRPFKPEKAEKWFVRSKSLSGSQKQECLFQCSVRILSILS